MLESFTKKEEIMKHFIIGDMEIFEILTKNPKKINILRVILVFCLTNAYSSLIHTYIYVHITYL